MTEEIKEILDDMKEIPIDESWALNLEDYQCKLLLNYITNLQKELDQYKNNWEELKEYLNNGINYWEEQEKEWIEQGFMKFGGEANTKIIYQGILNKMKELEENK